jgi:hypothetical protein
MRPFPRWLTLTLLGVLSVNATNRANAQKAQVQNTDTTVAVVFDANGTWIRDTQAVSPGIGLRRTDTLRLRTSANAKKYITVVMNDSRLVRFGCQGTCPPFVLADSLVRGSWISRGTKTMVQLMQLFRAKPADQFVGLSRSTESLREAVLALRGDTVTLTPAFAQVSPGRYTTRLIPVSGITDTANEKPRWYQTSVDWDPKAPKPGVFADLPPGLYELSLKNAETPFDQPALTWVLIARDPATFTQATATLQRTRVLTQSWKHASERDVRIVLRAALFDLSMPGDARTP